MSREIPPIRQVQGQADPVRPLQQIQQPVLRDLQPPVIQSPETKVPIVNSLDLPIVNIPNPTLNYPVIDVPTQEEFDASVQAQKQKEQEEKAEKTRGLPDAPPVLPAIEKVLLAPSKEASETVQPTTQAEKPISAEMQVPILGSVPIPTNKEVALAGTTAVAATAAAILGKSAVEFLLKFFKPIANQLFVRAKKLLNKDLTDYELQLYFAFEKEQQMKKVAKLLKKEYKKEKVLQYKKDQERKIN